MATINVYGPFRETLDENTRVMVQYSHDQGVTIGVDRASADPSADGHPTFGATPGHWSDLDRTGCNNLIRAVREARDKAYGRDE